MPIWPDTAPDTFQDPQIKACLALIGGVSHRAQTRDCDLVGRPGLLTNIRNRTPGGPADNKLRIWYWPDENNIRACCSFQLMRHLGGTSMCIGFNTTVFPMNRKEDCVIFLSTVAGTGQNDGLLLDCLLNYIAPPVLIVDMPQNRNHSTKLCTLLDFVTNPNHSPVSGNWNWTPSVLKKRHSHCFWGGANLTIWKVVPTLSF